MQLDRPVTNCAYIVQGLDDYSKSFQLAIGYLLLTSLSIPKAPGLVAYSVQAACSPIARHCPKRAARLPEVASKLTVAELWTQLNLSGSWPPISKIVVCRSSMLMQQFCCVSSNLSPYLLTWGVRSGLLERDVTENLACCAIDAHGIAPVQTPLQSTVVHCKPPKFQPAERDRGERVSHGMPL